MALHKYPALQPAHPAHPDRLYCPRPHGPVVGDVDDLFGQVYPALQFAQALHPDSEYCPAPHASRIGVDDATSLHT